MNKHDQILYVICGTFLGVLDSIKFENVIVTIIMAVIGTVTSFFITLVLKRLTTKK